MLATRWRTHPDAPTWAKKHTPTTWAALLAEPARHGWTTRDLIQLLDDHATAGHRLIHHPRRPIAYLGWLLHQVDLDDRPCALDDAQHAADLAAAARRKAEQAATHTQHLTDRHTAQAALGGPGHTAAQAAAQVAAARARGRGTPGNP